MRNSTVIGIPILKGLNFNPDAWLRIPGYNPIQDYVLLKVEGEAMSPTVLNNDVLICQRRQNFESIPNQTLVVYKTNDQFIIKRLKFHKDPQFFWMENDNVCYEKIFEEVKKSQIRELAVVRGKLNDLAVSNRKFNTLADDIKILKSELAKFKRK